VVARKPRKKSGQSLTVKMTSGFAFIVKKYMVKVQNVVFGYLAAILNLINICIIVAYPRHSPINTQNHLLNL
jgi:hypothetical protein